MAKPLDTTDHPDMTNCLTIQGPSPTTSNMSSASIDSSPWTNLAEGPSTKKREGELLEKEPSKRQKCEESPKPGTVEEMIKKLEAEHDRREGFGGWILPKEDFVRLALLAPETKHLLSLGFVAPDLMKYQLPDEEGYGKMLLPKPIGTLPDVPPTNEADFWRWASKEIIGYSNSDASELFCMGWRSSQEKVDASRDRALVLLAKHFQRLQERKGVLQHTIKWMKAAGGRANSALLLLEVAEYETDTRVRLWENRLGTFKKKAKA